MERIYGSPGKTCVYPQILFTLYRKNFISVTPLSDALNAFILALNDSAEAMAERFVKKFKISSYIYSYCRLVCMIYIFLCPMFYHQILYLDFSYRPLAKIQLVFRYFLPEFSLQLFWHFLLRQILKIYDLYDLL